MNYRNIRRLPAYLLAAVFFFTGLRAANAESWTKDLARGITLTQIVDQPNGNSDSPQIINVLRVDPNAPGVRIQASIGRDRMYAQNAAKGRETVRTIARRLQAVAAVNADYFPWTGAPIGLLISDGELMKDPWLGRVVFGMTSDNKFLFDKVGLDARVTIQDGRFYSISGLNRSRGKNEIVAYTSRFSTSTGTSREGTEAVVRCDNPPVRLGTPLTGVVTSVRESAGNTPIPHDSVVLSGSFMGAKFITDNLKPGTAVTTQFNVRGFSTGGWEKVTQSVGGGPWLVQDGRVSVDGAEEKFQPSFCNGAHPRTAVGVTCDGKLVIVTVDGRQSLSCGMSLHRLANFMKSQGCVQAMNLDGGGSTTMATSTGLLNSPSEGSERPVADALAVFGTIPSIEELRASVSQDSKESKGGYTELASRGEYGNLPPSARANVDKQPSADKGAFIIAPPAIVRIGSPCSMVLLDGSTYRPLDASMAEKAIWSTTGGIGFIDQSGTLHPLRARKGTINVAIGGSKAKLDLEVVSGGQMDEIGTDPTDAPSNKNAPEAQSPLPQP